MRVDLKPEDLKTKRYVEAVNGIPQVGYEGQTTFLLI